MMILESLAVSLSTHHFEDVNCTNGNHYEVLYSDIEDIASPHP